MKLKKFKERDNKRISIIVFTITCILLVSGVIFYRTFAIFEVRTNQNVIKGTVQDPGNLYFAFYQKNEENGEYEIKKDMPNLEEDYVLDEIQSYCGVNGEKDEDIEVYLLEDGYIKVKGMKTSRTKCNLYFAKGVFIKEKGIPVVTSGDGLYEVPHSAEETSGIDSGWQAAEYRYAGENPNNYVWFNEELWRIIGLVNVKVKKEDGSEGIEQRLKIIRANALNDSYGWDHKPANQGSSTSEYGSNDWTDSQLMEMLNGIYYKSESGTCWKSDFNTASLQSTCNFSSAEKTKGLDELSRKMIDENIIWNIGAIDTLDVASKMYLFEREKGVYTNDISFKRSTEWQKENTRSSTTGILDSSLFHSVSLMYPSDYIYAVAGKSREKCLKSVLLDQYNTSVECTNSDWLFLNSAEWLLTPSMQSSYYVFVIDTLGFIHLNVAMGSYSIRPVVYLLSNITISSGTGTADDMFKLSLKLTM